VLRAIGSLECLTLVLTDHVVLEVECIRRLQLNVYQPRLQYPGAVAGFLVGHRGARFASSALMDPITKAIVASVHRFARDQRVPVDAFGKGKRKAGHLTASLGLVTGRRRHRPEQPTRHHRRRRDETVRRWDATQDRTAAARSERSRRAAASGGRSRPTNGCGRASQRLPGSRLQGVLR